MYTVLKPQGFRKSGSCFRRELGLSSVASYEDCERYAEIFGMRFLPCLNKYLEKTIENARWQELQDMSQYDELLQQYHKKKCGRALEQSEIL